MSAVGYSTQLEAIGLALMLAELESSQLQVVLAPCRRHANEGGCIRVCADRNCTWYRRFCAAHGSSRFRRKALHDTCIKRRDTQRLLGRMIEGRATRSKYALELLSIARQTASGGLFSGVAS